MPTLPLRARRNGRQPAMPRRSRSPVTIVWNPRSEACGRAPRSAPWGCAQHPQPPPCPSAPLPKYLPLGPYCCRNLGTARQAMLSRSDSLDEATGLSSGPSVQRSKVRNTQDCPSTCTGCCRTTSTAPLRPRKLITAVADRPKLATVAILHRLPFPARLFPQPLLDFQEPAGLPHSCLPILNCV